MKKCLFVAFIVLLLIGCQIVKKGGNKTLIKNPIKTKNKLDLNKHDTKKEQVGNNTSLIKTKTHNFKWKSYIKPLINQMIYLPVIKTGGVLLVDNVHNQTNGRLKISHANKAIQEVLIQCNKFILVPNRNIINAKQYLGLSNKDNLGSRRKAIDIARIVHAQYVLYTTVVGNTKSPKINMQLMLVETGEILWYGDSLLTS